MKAHASLAKCYVKINDIDNAQKHFQEYFEIAKQHSNKSMNAQADAAHNLGNLEWKKGNVQEALHYYKLYFEHATKEKHERNRREIDNARIALALAKGTHEIGRPVFYKIFLDSFLEQTTDSKDNIQPQLEWKLKKEKN